MSHPVYSDDEIARRGREIYEQKIRRLVEVDDNIGKIVSIDIETGEYQVGEDLLTVAGKLQAIHPNAAVWSERIGYEAVYALGAGPLLAELPQPASNHIDRLVADISAPIDVADLSREAIYAK